MKINILMISIILSVVGYSQSVYLDWVKTAGGSSLDGLNSITQDDSGNIYLTGFFKGTVDFDFGIGVQNISASSSAKNIFIQKIDDEGELIWVKTIGGTNDLQGGSIEVDSQGNVYVSGTLRGSNVDFDPGNGIYHLSSNGSSDGFILKLDPNGVFLWAKNVGGDSTDDITDFKIDPFGDIVLVGVFKGTVDFDLGVGVDTISANSGTLPELFILKLDSTGDFYWVKNIGMANFPNEYSSYFTSIDELGNIYISGVFKGVVDFDPDPIDFSFVFSNSNPHVAVVKLDLVGDFQWVTMIDDQGGGEHVNAMKLDNAGAVILCGTYSSTTDFDPSSGVVSYTSQEARDIYIEKLDTNGNFIWVHTIQGYRSSLNNPQSLESIKDLAVDDSNNLYLVGVFGDVLEDGQTILYSNGNDDCFIEKLNNSGNLEWLESFGGSGMDKAMSVVFSSFGLFVGGYYSDSVDFDLGMGVEYCDAIGAQDFFIEKFLFDCNTPVDNSITIDNASLMANEAFAVYQWVDCDSNYSIISGETGQSFLPATNGNYAVIVSKNGCTDTSSCQLINNVGLNEFEWSDVQVFPNPTEESVHIQLGKLKNVKVGLYSIEGKELVRCRDVNSLDYELELLQLKSGVYFISVTSEGKQKQFKLIKK